MAHNQLLLFHPTFGSRPEKIVGRDTELSLFLNALDEPIGSRNRCTLFLGQRGMGKTALLLELEERATQKGYVVARVTAHENLTDNIIEQIQLKGTDFINSSKRHVKGVSAGALGFSFGLTFSEATQTQYGFRTKLTLLCDKLAEHEKNILILIDEVQNSAAMREVATAYQELVGERKNIAIAMAGLPHAISSVLNDSVLTFLNRANKLTLGPISISEIRAYYAHAIQLLGISCTDEDLDALSKMTRGMPYLMQLVGYYLVQYTQDTKKVDAAVLHQVEQASLVDMEANVFAPILAPLSDNDLFFLRAMAQCEQEEGSIRTNLLQDELGDKASALQPYRKRLIDAGVISSPRRGELVFNMPYLADYILKVTEGV